MILSSNLLEFSLQTGFPEHSDGTKHQQQGAKCREAPTVQVLQEACSQAAWILWWITAKRTVNNSTYLHKWERWSHGVKRLGYNHCFTIIYKIHSLVRLGLHVHCKRLIKLSYPILKFFQLQQLSLKWSSNVSSKFNVLRTKFWHF